MVAPIPIPWLLFHFQQLNVDYLIWDMDTNKENPNDKIIGWMKRTNSIQFQIVCGYGSSVRNYWILHSGGKLWSVKGRCNDQNILIIITYYWLHSISNYNSWGWSHTKMRIANCEVIIIIGVGRFEVCRFFMFNCALMCFKFRSRE